MPDAKRIFVVAALVLGVAAGGYAFTRPAPTPMLLVSDARAAPLAEAPDSFAVFLTIENSGGPDRLVAVDVPGATAVLEAPDTAGLAVPAGAAPSLAADGAWLRVQGMEGGTDGRLIPLTLTFAEAGPVTAKARLVAAQRRGAAEAYGLFGLGDICVVEPGEPAPEVALRVTPDGAGWAIHVETEDFTFSRDETGVHVAGEGHGHVYVGGLKLGRLYEPTLRIGALPPGAHEITVTLNTNDHRAYVVEDAPVVARAVIHQG